MNDYSQYQFSEYHGKRRKEAKDSVDLEHLWNTKWNHPLRIRIFDISSKHWRSHVNDWRAGRSIVHTSYIRKPFRNKSHSSPSPPIMVRFPRVICCNLGSSFYYCGSRFKPSNRVRIEYMKHWSPKWRSLRLGRSNH